MSSGRSLPLAVIAAVGVSFLVVSCGSPERAPRQPISGVDRPWPEDGSAPDRAVSPDDALSPESAPAPREEEEEEEEQARVISRSALDAFVADITRARGNAGGPVAVFWPLSESPLRRGDYQINGLGERVALEIADGLRAAGITPISGSTLINDIKASGRCLHDLRTLDDVYWLAQKIGAVYVAYGTVDMREYHRLRGDRELEVRLFCKRLGDNTDVARLQRRIPPGPQQRALYRDFAQASAIAIGDAAVPCPPDKKTQNEKVAPDSQPKTSCRLRSSQMAERGSDGGELAVRSVAG